MAVNPGDWIITGVKGERYPCRADIFEATYEPADTPPSPLSEAKDRVVEAAKKYCETREYQNVEACHKNQDRLANELEFAVEDLRQAEAGEGASRAQSKGGRDGE